jgi:hypothetical protein
LRKGSDPPRVSIYRRDAYDHQVASFWPRHRQTLEQAEKKNPGQDVAVHAQGRLGGVLLRTPAYPEIDFQLWAYDPATPPDVAEQALRKFLRERLKRVDPVS